MKITYEVHTSDTFDAYTNSRLALKQILTNRGHAINDLKIDLAMSDFQNLEKFPDYLTSISHTKGAGACALAHKNDCLSLGIDIEWSDRPMKKEAQKFFRHPEDSDNKNDLELWTMKEAAFKALSPLGFPGVLVLSKIIIRNGQFWTNERPELVGSLESNNIVIENKKLCLTIAHIRK